jgi:hypothetical protein
MSIPLSEAAANQIPSFQEKWRNIAFSTEAINPERAIAAVKKAYLVNGFSEPQIYLCASPHTGLQKLVELIGRLGNLGGNLNQEIQLHNDWLERYGNAWHNYSKQVIGNLSRCNISEPLTKHLAQTVMQRSDLDNIAYDTPTAEDDLNTGLEKLGQMMTLAHKIPLSACYSWIDPASMASNYCFFDFGFSVLQWSQNIEKWLASEALLTHCGWIMPFEKVCVVCDRPSKILLDDYDRLHSVGESALSYRDGTDIYVRYGELYLGQQFLIADYSQEPNPQIRRSIIEESDASDLEVGFLLQESNYLIRNLLLEKIGLPKLLAEWDLNRFFEISASDLEGTGSLVWLLYTAIQHPENPSIIAALRAMRIENLSNKEKLLLFRKTIITNCLERIKYWLQQNTSDVEEEFLPGLSQDEISSQLSKLQFYPSHEIFDLYELNNGNTTEEDLFLYYQFPSLEDSLNLSSYLNSAEYDFIEGRLQSGLPKYLLSIFNSQGECFAVGGSDGNYCTSPVYHVLDCYDYKLVFNSIATMLLTLADCYEMGNYQVDEEYGLQWDSESPLFDQLRQKYNPGTEVFE